MTLRRNESVHDNLAPTTTTTTTTITAPSRSKRSYSLASICKVISSADFGSPAPAAGARTQARTRRRPPYFFALVSPLSLRTPRLSVAAGSSGQAAAVCEFHAMGTFRRGGQKERGFAMCYFLTIHGLARNARSIDRRMDGWMTARASSVRPSVLLCFRTRGRRGL